jgi:hypothetical protein
LRRKWLWTRYIFEITQRFFGFGAQGKLSFTLGPATFAQLLDISAETRSLLPKNNPTLTMFPQKDFT